MIVSKEPPKDIASSVKDTEGLTTFVVFGTSWTVVVCHLVLFAHHYETEEKRERCISLILGFRDYVHYHIKATKAFMHTRMRGKVSAFLKVLHRAEPDYTALDRKK